MERVFIQSFYFLGADLFGFLKVIPSILFSIAVTLSCLPDNGRAQAIDNTGCSALGLPNNLQGFDTITIDLSLETFASHEDWQVILTTKGEARLLPLSVLEDGSVQTTMPFLDGHDKGMVAHLFILAKDAAHKVTFECAPHVFLLSTPPVRDGAFADIIVRPVASDPVLDGIPEYAAVRAEWMASADEVLGSYEQAPPEERRALDALATHLLTRAGAFQPNPQQPAAKPKKIRYRPGKLYDFPKPARAVFRPNESPARIFQAFQPSDVVQLIPIRDLERCPRNGQELTEMTGILAQANLRSEEWDSRMAFSKKGLRTTEVMLVSIGAHILGGAGAAKKTQAALDAYITIQDTMDDIIRGSLPTQYKKLDGTLSIHKIYENSPQRFRNVEIRNIKLHTSSSGYSISKAAIDIILLALGTETAKKILPKDLMNSRLVPQKIRDVADDLQRGYKGYKLNNPFETTVVDGLESKHMHRLRAIPNSATDPAIVRELYFNTPSQAQVIKDDASFQFAYDKISDKVKGDIKGKIDPKTRAESFIKDTAKKEANKLLQEAQEGSDGKQKTDKSKSNVEGFSSKKITCEIDLTDWLHVYSKVLDLPLGNALEKTGTANDHRFLAVRAGLGVVQISLENLPDVFQEIKQESVSGTLRKKIPFLETTIEGPAELNPGETGFYQVAVTNAHPGEDLFFEWTNDATLPVEDGPMPENGFFITAPTGKCNLHYALLSVDGRSDFLSKSDADRTMPRTIALLPDKEDPACEELEAEEAYHGNVWNTDTRSWHQTDLNGTFTCQFWTYGDDRNRWENAPHTIDTRDCKIIDMKAFVSADRRTLTLKTPDDAYVFKRQEIRYSEVKDDFLRAGAFPASPAPPMDLFRLPKEAARISKADPWMYTRERRPDEASNVGLQAFIYGPVAYMINTMDLIEFSILYRIPYVSYEGETPTADQLFPEEVPDEKSIWAVPVDDEG